MNSDEHELSITRIVLETRRYRVVGCAGGVEALGVFRRGGIDLVLSTLADGSELVRALKIVAPALPVILFSHKLRHYQLDTLATHFFGKGEMSPAGMLEKIRVLLIRKRGPKRFIIPEVAIAASA